MNYTFYSQTSSVSGYSPLTITFVPSAIPLTGNQFLSRVAYQTPTGNFSFTNNFTSTPDNTDCRTNFTYTLPGNLSTYVLVISAFIGPNSFVPTVYTLSATNVAPYFTTNPAVLSASPYVFGEVHLLRSRAWDTVNTQMFLLETNNPNYLLINYNG